MSPFSNAGIIPRDPALELHTEAEFLEMAHRRGFEVRTVMDAGRVTNYVNFVDTPYGGFAHVASMART